MTDYYVYLISSLPALTFGMKPPFSFDILLARCAELIPPEDVMEVERVRHAEALSRASSGNAVLRRWIGFDMMIRNELVKIRAARRHADPARYLREDGVPESSYAAHIVVNAVRRPSILEAEKALDSERWTALDEFTTGRYFDLDVLVAYACKLLILEKWERIETADANTLLEGALVP